MQEVAFTFANAIAYVEAAQAAGLDVNSFGQRLSFFFNAHNDFLEEIAKFRAARRLWARIMRDRFGATNPRAQQLRFHTQTAGSTLTAQQPDNNIVRVALQALAAVLGGTQSLHCNGRDEALALPTEESARIALRTQQIIAAEIGRGQHGRSARRRLVHRGADQPDRSGGARRCSRGSTRAGGTLAAIEQGLIQREIQDSAYRAQLAIDAGDQRRGRRQPVRHGRRAAGIDVLRIDPELERAQIERVARGARRAGRTPRGAARSTRSARRREARTTWCRRSSPAVEARATVGEIADALRARVRRAYRDRCLIGAAARRRASHHRLRHRRAGSCPRSIDVSFRLGKGETLGLVGESGSGKSLTAFSIMRLVQPPGRIAAGRRHLQGARPARRCPSARCSACAAREIALIFQEPMTALNPVFTHRQPDRGDAAGARRRDAPDRARAGHRAARAVRIPEPTRRVRDYPHQLSGGLRQRALIAMALACDPTLVIADEPTTALDVTIQAQILDLLRDLQRRSGLALLLITHDLGVVAEMADRVAVMYAGRIVEAGAGQGAVRGSEAPLHARPDGVDSRRRARHAAARHSRHRAAARSAAARLRVRAALPEPLRALPDRAARRHRASESAGR